MSSLPLELLEMEISKWKGYEGVFIILNVYIVMILLMFL